MVSIIYLTDSILISYAAVILNFFSYIYIAVAADWSGRCAVHIRDVIYHISSKNSALLIIRHPLPND